MAALVAGCSAGSGVQDLPSAAPTTTTTGGSSPPPAASTPASILYPATAAVSVEIAIRARESGCWSEAEPGSRFGAYRQDYYCPAGQVCRGGSWAVDIELFNQAAPPTAAERAAPAGSMLYRAANTLLIVSATAPAGLRQVVPTLPGVVAVNR